jgi:hypothetical protein
MFDVDVRPDAVNAIALATPITPAYLSKVR